MDSAIYGPIATRRYPWAFAALALGLLVLGWATIARCEQINDSSNRLVRQQVVWSVLGMGGMVVISVVDYRRFARFSFVLYWIAFASLLFVYFFPAINGAHRWIRWGAFGLQPSEFTKVVFILSLARLLIYHDDAQPLARGFFWPLVMTLLPMLLILKEPDLGTSLVFLPILLAMLFAAGARQRDLVRFVVASLLLFPLLWSQMSHDQRSRVIALWEQNAPQEPATADGFHLDQAKRMLSLGKIWGTQFEGEMNDEPISLRLPEAQTDSIFCVLAERFGLVGSGLMLLLFAILVTKCLAAACQTQDAFGRLIAVGVATLFGAEVLINTGMMVGLLPITGLALPLISYGGSNLMAHLWALGLSASVARHMNADRVAI